MAYGTAALFVSPRAAAQPDFDPNSAAWNGMSALSGVAEAISVPLEVETRLDLDALGTDAALLLVHPTRPLPLDSLGAFLRRGGRVLLADDHGRGVDLLARYGITRRPVPGDAPVLRSDPDLPLAVRRGRHALTEGVDVVATNHPTAVSHDALEPLLAFDEGPAALLTGAVGEGRLVVLSDPSALINEMMAFGGNRQLARNALRYLLAGGASRVILMHDGFVLEGRGAGPEDPRRTLGAWLAEIARADAPPAALWLGAGLILLLTIVVAATGLPRRSPYREDAMFTRDEHTGGLEGRIALHRDGAGAPLSALMHFKAELELALVRTLGLRGRPSLGDVLDAAARNGRLDADDRERLRALLLELEDLREREDRPPGPPRVPKSRFRAMVSTGRSLLERLDPTPRT